MKSDIESRIAMMERNLSRSRERYDQGEITREQYEILEKDVKKATKRLRSNK